MQLIIKAAEVWLPDPSGRFLTLSSCHYGSLHEFETASKPMAFAYGEGLPGQSWKLRHPLLWTDLSSQHFLRSEVAARAGIECGLAIPVFSGEFLLSVLTLFCGRGNSADGAIEIWSNQEDSANELKLDNGYYGNMDSFEWISRRLSIMRGRGLPGIAWEQGEPHIMSDLIRNTTFLRARSAAECGINTGLAIPYLTENHTGQQAHIITLLSNDENLIAMRFEIWTPDPRHEYLVFHSGYCAASGPLDKRYSNRAYARGQGAVGESWLTGRPIITQTDFGEGERGVYLPLNHNGNLSAVIVFVL